MGMFDTVYVPCPKCGLREEFQSKSGDCILAQYNMEKCPWDVLKDVNRHAPKQCEKCGSWFKVQLDDEPSSYQVGPPQ